MPGLELDLATFTKGLCSRLLELLCISLRKLSCDCHNCPFEACFIADPTIARDAWLILCKTPLRKSLRATAKFTWPL